MTVSVAAARGYILEEALVALTRNAGYDLLSATSDPNELRRGPNGLLVRGRGGWHQADVLGQFRWTPPFGFPIRLFLEAKFHSNRIGVPEIRKAIGAISDINQSMSPIRSHNPGGLTPSPAYRYSFALASTKGFAKEAGALALAHQISLIDLSLPEYQALRDSIAQLANVAVRLWRDGRVAPQAQLPALRHQLRVVLGTQPAEPDQDEDQLVPDGEEELRAEGGRINALQQGYNQAIRGVLQAVTDIGELFLGTANGPFVLLLRADNREEFLAYTRQRRRHHVHIRRDRRSTDSWSWSISPADPFPNTYTLRFALPELMSDWIGSQGDSVRQATRTAKQIFLPRISIYRMNEQDGDELFQLEYEPSDVGRRIGG
jgi:hypothetical protein